MAFVVKEIVAAKIKINFAFKYIHLNVIDFMDYISFTMNLLTFVYFSIIQINFSCLFNRKYLKINLKI